VYGVIYAIESDGFSEAEVKTTADEIRQKLLRVPDVNKVELVRRAGRKNLHRDFTPAAGATGFGYESRARAAQ